MRYLDLDCYGSDPRVIDFFSLASDCLVHGEMLVLALGTPYSTPDDTEHYRPGYTDNVNMSMRLLSEAVEIGLLIRGEFKPSAQQRFFGIEGRFGREIKAPINNGEMFSHSILYQYHGNRSKIYAHFGWIGACTRLMTAKEMSAVTIAAPTWLSSYNFLRSFWPNHSLNPADIVKFRSIDRSTGWLEAIQGRMTVEQAADDSTREIVRCLSPCVCGELLVNLAVYLRDAGYNILTETEVLS